mmetsp:Transcript_47531/g.107760  ORF Transcript_47531/g.107760 Transcript_47531/m.107760 type:complete len:221 (+) Transcript_47531:1775-2437(+)
MRARSSWEEEPRSTSTKVQNTRRKSGSRSDLVSSRARWARNPGSMCRMSSLFPRNTSATTWVDWMPQSMERTKRSSDLCTTVWFSLFPRTKALRSWLHCRSMAVVSRLSPSRRSTSLPASPSSSMTLDAATAAAPNPLSEGKNSSMSITNTAPPSRCRSIDWACGFRRAGCMSSGLAPCAWAPAPPAGSTLKKPAKSPRCFWTSRATRFASGVVRGPHSS